MVKNKTNYPLVSFGQKKSFNQKQNLFIFIFSAFSACERMCVCVFCERERQTDRVRQTVVEKKTDRQTNVDKKTDRQTVVEKKTDKQAKIM